jgi:hypothetical protein
MHTHVIGTNRSQSLPGTSRAVAYLGAAAFAMGVIWFGLAEHGITEPSAPPAPPHQPAQDALRLYYQWMASTLPQERLYTALVILGFLCLAVVTAFVRDLLGRDCAGARTGTLLIAAGAVLWITGSVFQLGAHRAIGLMATHSNPIQTTNSIAFTAQTISQAFSLAAFAVMGAGLLLTAWHAAQALPRARGWAGFTALVAVFMLVIAWSYAAGLDDVNDVLLLIGGVVLLPSWLVWTGRASRSATAVTSGGPA